MSPPTARGKDLAAVSGFDEAMRAALEQEIFRQIEAGWRDTVDLPLATLVRKTVNTGTATESPSCTNPNSAPNRGRCISFAGCLVDNIFLTVVLEVPVRIVALAQSWREVTETQYLELSSQPH